MGGINVYCGSFEGDDKSCSALQGVLEGMEQMASEPERSLIARITESLVDEEADHLLAGMCEAATPAEQSVIDAIKASVPEADDHILIPPADARTLLPLLRRYAAETDSRLASAARRPIRPDDQG